MAIDAAALAATAKRHGKTAGGHFARAGSTAASGAVDTAQQGGSSLLSGRGSGILLAAVLILGTRYLLSGKLSRIWSAAWSGQAVGPSSSPGSTAQGSAPANDPAYGPPNSGWGTPSNNWGDGNSQGVAPSQYSNGFPNPAEFGIPHASSFFDYITHGASQQVITEDSQGLGAPAAHDYDYGTPLGTPVTLPTGTYTLQQEWPDPRWGNSEVFQIQNGPYAGGHIELMHVQPVQGLSIGQTIHGGQQLGTTMAPPNGVSANWSGPHLSVITDILGAKYLTGGHG